MNQLTLPKGTILELDDTVNYRDNFGRAQIGVIKGFAKQGAHGWMRVEPGPTVSEWVSLTPTLRQFNETEIIVFKNKTARHGQDN